MKAAGYSETSTRRHIPEDITLHTDCHDNVEFQISRMFIHFLHIYNQDNYMQDPNVITLQITTQGIPVLL